MRKILLPPLLLLLLVACAESGTVMSPRETRVRFDVTTEAELTATAVNGKILPAAYAIAMGETNNSWPHARGNMRYQQVFLGTELGDMDRIAGLCLRHDELVSGRQLTENLTVKLGPTNLNNTNLGNTFDANYSVTAVGNVYTRIGNPTQTALEARVNALEGGVTTARRPNGTDTLASGATVNVKSRAACPALKTFVSTPKSFTEKRGVT